MVFNMLSESFPTLYPVSAYGDTTALVSSEQLTSVWAFSRNGCVGVVVSAGSGGGEVVGDGLEVGKAWLWRYGKSPAAAGGGVYRWYAEGSRVAAAHALPAAVFRRLPGYDAGYGWCVFATERDAVSAASDAVSRATAAGEL